MEDLIKALNIFLKYTNTTYPTSCDHDVLRVHHIEYSSVSEQDISELDKLGFNWCDESESFVSNRFGSC